MKKITALLKTRTVLVGLLALVALASMAAIASAAPGPNIPADATAPANHYAGACSTCHTIDVVTPPPSGETSPSTPPSGETSPVVPPVVPGVGHDSDDCSDTLEADDCSDDDSGTIEADDCADDAAEDAAEHSGAVESDDEDADEVGGIDDDSHQAPATPAAQASASARGGSHETVGARVSEHGVSASAQGGMNSTRSHSSERGAHTSGTGSESDD